MANALLRFTECGVGIVVLILFVYRLIVKFEDKLFGLFGLRETASRWQLRRRKRSPAEEGFACGKKSLALAKARLGLRPTVERERIREKHYTRRFLHFYSNLFRGEAEMDKSRPRQRKLSVYLYIPNIIGYLRVLMNVVAFALCSSNKKIFSVLYFFSFVCDGVDGWCARKFNQVSTFGAVLDMVTDRISTACLLVILSQVYRPGLVFLGLLALDISSHWLQMYSTFLSGKVSHKDVKDSTSWLFRLYYGNRMFMAYCCVACEVLYIILFLLAEKQTENLMHVLLSSAQNLLLFFLVCISLFGWAVKQAINVIQMKTAADVCVLYDINKKQKA